jgi:hypothetical protein
MNKYKIGDKVYHQCDAAPFIVTDIKEDEVEIAGDWSGGTHNVHISGWVRQEEIQPYDDSKPTYYFNGKPYKTREYFYRMKKALSICHDLLRDVDIYADQDEQSGYSVKNCSKIATEGLNKLYREFADLFLLPNNEADNQNKTFNHGK